MSLKNLSKLDKLLKKSKKHTNTPPQSQSSPTGMNETMGDDCSLLESALYGLKTLKIDNITYFLLNEHKIQKQSNRYQKEFDQLDITTKQSFKRDKETINTSLKNEKYKVKQNTLTSQECRQLIDIYESSPDKYLTHPIFSKLVMKCIQQSLDQELISYFESEYYLFWLNISKVGAHSIAEDCSTGWHCDMGPKNHLKSITYLNDYSEHESTTLLLSKDSTKKLIETGYIFTTVNHRQTNIKPLCNEFGIPYHEITIKPNAGDTIIFNPRQLVHRRLSSKKNCTRYCLNFCFLPSIYNWRKLAAGLLKPTTTSLSFQNLGRQLMALKDIEKKGDEVLFIDNQLALADIKFLLKNTIAQERVVDEVIRVLSNNSGHFNGKLTFNDYIETIKHILSTFEVEEGEYKLKFQNAIDEINQYKDGVEYDMSRYQPTVHIPINDLMWPDPTHPSHPASQYDAKPYIHKHLIMDKSTPIGSAGSCFAFEIAKYFQTEGYNYVVTERNDDSSKRMIIDNYTPGQKLALFSANYGILFNTPSFKQLAEKAFEIKKFKHIIAKHEELYFDPYRENVFFYSPAAYFADYPKHIEAIRNAFLKTEVFIITLGLNECWQLLDGTVISRNPRAEMHPYLKHKVLSVQENIDNIQTMYDIVKAHNPKFKLIISVSPIPFLATGRKDEHHIVTANCHSKSVLRVAAEELVHNNEDIYYLPSYELVTYCKQNAWDDDNRHVKSEVVKDVVKMFEEIFVRT